MDEKRPKLIGDSQNNMSMVTVEEFFGHGLGPDVGMFFAAARTELAFTAKADDFYFAAMGADVGGKAAVFSAAVEHFFGLMEDVIREFILVEFFKEYPIVITPEDRFKG